MSDPKRCPHLLKCQIFIFQRTKEGLELVTDPERCTRASFPRGGFRGGVMGAATS